VCCFFFDSFFNCYTWAFVSPGIGRWAEREKYIFTQLVKKITAILWSKEWSLQDLKDKLYAAT
jgi:hypothetical protein